MHFLTTVGKYLPAILASLVSLVWIWLGVMIQVGTLGETVLGTFVMLAYLVLLGILFWRSFHLWCRVF